MAEAKSAGSTARDQSVCLLTGGTVPVCLNCSRGTASGPAAPPRKASACLKAPLARAQVGARGLGRPRAEAAYPQICGLCLGNVCAHTLGQVTTGWRTGDEHPRQCHTRLVQSVPRAPALGAKTKGVKVAITLGADLLLGACSCKGEALVASTTGAWSQDYIG